MSVESTNDVSRLLLLSGKNNLLTKFINTHPTGLITPGNINLQNRPVVRNPDGSFSTVKSASFNFGGKEILLPTVSDDGRMLSNQEAVDLYRKTGKHLGIFRDNDSATKFAKALHEMQAKQYSSYDNQKPFEVPYQNNRVNLVDYVKFLSPK